MGQVGQIEGVSVVAERLTIIEKTDERFGKVEAEKCFWQAIEVARRQEVRFLELRAAMSLGRLWQRQGKNESARLVLAETYGWFTEGFDTVDLREAQVLLEELQAN